MTVAPPKQIRATAHAILPIPIVESSLSLIFGFTTESGDSRRFWGVQRVREARIRNHYWVRGNCNIDEAGAGFNKFGSAASRLTVCTPPSRSGLCSRPNSGNTSCESNQWSGTEEGE